MITANTSNDLNTETSPIDEDIHTSELKTASSIHSDSFISNILLEDIDQDIPITLTTTSKETNAVIAMKEQRETSQNAIKCSFLNDYIKSLLDQIEHVKGKVNFLRGELKDKNAFAKTLFNPGSDYKNQQNVYGDHALPPMKAVLYERKI